MKYLIVWIALCLATCVIGCYWHPSGPVAEQARERAK